MGLGYKLLAVVAVIASTEAVPFARKHVALPKVSILEPAASWKAIPRGGEQAAVPAKGGDSSLDIMAMVEEGLDSVKHHMGGATSDTLLLLLTTALIPTICGKLNTSPILGFLASGLFFGPKGRNTINDIHTTEFMADIGIVFFLFEMGLHLSLDTLIAMSKDVFGLGGCQVAVTAAIVATIAGLCGQSTAAKIVIGGGLALSSSAFVLQLLKDKDQLGTKFGKSSFGVLLFQDLAVVPLLVTTKVLGGSGDASAASAILSAVVKACMALTTIAVCGKFLLNPLFDAVAKTESQEAFIGAILTTVLGFSFLTEGLGLSNTLGAFLAGVLLSESKYNHKIEKEISPFRGILVGLFFFTVGFEIDLNLIASKFGLVSSVVLGLMALKTVITTAICMAFGQGLPTAQRVGLILSQGGEFGFVAFRMAREYGILDADTTKLLMTSVALTMALTPFVEEIGGKLAINMEKEEVPVKGVKGGKKKKN